MSLTAVRTTATLLVNYVLSRVLKKHSAAGKCVVALDYKILSVTVIIYIRVTQISRVLPFLSLLCDACELE